MSSAAATRISVVICGYTDERFDDMLAATRSVKAQTLPAHEIVIVIDHNSHLLERLRLEFPDLRVLPNAGGRGVSGARNTGIQSTEGDIVAFLDDDAVADPDWLARVILHYDDPNVAAVGGAAVPRWPVERPKWLPREFDWVVGCSFRGQPTVAGPARNLWGCNMSARRSAIEIAGGFNEGLGRTSQNGAGCEETELCIKIRQAASRNRIIYDPSIVVVQHISGLRTRWRYFRSRCLAEGHSKARLTAEVGSDDGLSDERHYVFRTLPMGVLGGLADTLLRFDPWGVVRAANIVAGLGLTAWSYAAGRRRTASPPPFAPIRIVEFDINDGLPTIEAEDPETGKQYNSALCLVRRGGRAIGQIEIDGLPVRVTKDMLAQDNGPDNAGHALARVSPTPEPPPVSVVVATRDRPDSLARTLDSLLRQDYPQFDIIVADSAPSSTATAAMIAERYKETGRVRYTRTKMPGLGHAHNRGMALAASPIIAFTDDDVIADRRWLAALAANFDRRGSVGCVTGLILPAELETRAQFWTERHGAFGKGFSSQAYELDNPPTDRPLFPYTAGQFGSGANMAYLTEALRRIGGFDDALGAGTLARSGDDLLGFYKILRAGYRLVYEPQSIVWHFHRRQEEGMHRQAVGYGMGLGAYLTAVVLSEPAAALRLAGALPTGLRHMWGPKSPRMQRLPSDYPRNLVWRERLGVLLGPGAYLLSRIAVRRDIQRRRHSAAAPELKSGTPDGTGMRGHSKPT